MKIITNRSWIFILLIPLLLLSYTPLRADNPTENNLAWQYRNWSVAFGPTLYRPATVIPSFGEHTIANKSIPSYTFGVLYSFNPQFKWSFSTGILINNEPAYNLTFKIDKTDLFPPSQEDFVYRGFYYQKHSMSLPFLLERNIPLGNIRLTLSAGLKAMFYTPIGTEFYIGIENNDENENRDVFGFYAETQDIFFHGSFVTGIGLSYATKWNLLKANFIYSANFQNLYEGEYQFANLLTSPPSRGFYSLSGDYIGLLLSVNLKKRGLK